MDERDKSNFKNKDVYYYYYSYFCYIFYDKKHKRAKKKI